MTTQDRPLREIKSFGRRDGRPLSTRQRRLYDTLFPQLEVPKSGPLSAKGLFGDARPLWLEIGFGGAEHLIRRARLNPDVGIIGAEPFHEGVAKALGGVEDHSLTNVRLHDDDIRLILSNFGEAAFERCFILFPDPWPKKRQQKRRLIQPSFLDELAFALKPGAAVRFATDVMSYADEALWRFLQHGAFEWHATRADDWRKQPEDHEPTRYQLKKLGDCEPVWLEFTRR